MQKKFLVSKIASLIALCLCFLAYAYAHAVAGELNRKSEFRCIGCYDGPNVAGIAEIAQYFVYENGAVTAGVFVAHDGSFDGKAIGATLTSQECARIWSMASNLVAQVKGDEYDVEEKMRRMPLGLPVRNRPNFFIDFTDRIWSCRLPTQDKRICAFVSIVQDAVANALTRRMAEMRPSRSTEVVGKAGEELEVTPLHAGD